MYAIRSYYGHRKGLIRSAQIFVPDIPDVYWIEVQAGVHLPDELHRFSGAFCLGSYGLYVKGC